ncbi:MAG TPA: mycofactocin-associated electron transfer flavoprotein beta subunit [Acidimicrobiales bacterium]
MIAACLKWVDRRPEVDPLTGAVHTDARMSGPSDADEAALEWALRLGEARRQDVVAVTAGPPAAEAVLREALAAGATGAVRVGVADGAPSEEVARALAAGLGGRPDVVVCGVWSLDRGSGAVPAFLAAELGAAQALGLISLTIGAGLAAERRLDGGRRERLAVPTPAVLSVEGGSARLRRAPVGSVIAATRAPIRTVAFPASPPPHPPVTTHPFRPRARVLPGPNASLSARERILALTGALREHEPAQTQFLDPPAAAAEIIERLRAWGYVT